MTINLKEMKNMKKIALLAFAGVATLTLLACKKNKAPISGRDTSNADKSLKITKADSLQKMRKLASEGGYHIAYDFRMGEVEDGVDASALGEKAVYYRKDGSGIALDHADPHYHIFLKDAEEEAFEYLMSFKTDVYDQWYGEGSMMFYAHNLNLTYREAGTATVLDRQCITYSFEYDYGAEEKKPYTLYLDAELGITLKLECTKEGAPNTETVYVEAKVFEIGGDIQIPELPEVTEIVDGDALIREDWKNTVPEKIRFSSFHGAYNAEYPYMEYTELLGNDVYFYTQTPDQEFAVFYKWNGSSYQCYARDYAEEIAWHEDATSPVNGKSPEKGQSAAELALSFHAGSLDPFHLANLYGTRMVGYDTVHGLPVSVYEQKNGYKYYLNEQYSMFLKIESKEDYRFEMTDFSFDFNAFTDSPDHPRESNPNIFDLAN